MLFPTIDFAIFFGIVFVGNWLLRVYGRAWKLFILLASYVFYAWWDWRFVLLLWASTALTTIGGQAISTAPSPARKRAYLIATLVGELGLLGYFKYYGFVSSNLDNLLHHLGLSGTPIPLLNVTLPVGISFFTFMGVSYVIDVYRGRIEPGRPIDVAVYVAFFPHLVAGPIVRAETLLPEIVHATHRDPRHVDFSTAAYLIFGGLFKKVVISSYVSSAIVDPVFATPNLHSAPEILLAVYGYAVQIYCDFSGYTDIAIGCALLLGFHFPQNFDAPYRATSLQDFWRRWHITLSMWLRDYLYIPLGGNRGGRLATARNIMITMVLGGLWHGAAWTFIAWGAIHGLGQVLGHERRLAGLVPDQPSQSMIWRQRLITFHVVCFGWLFFRAASFSDAFTMLGRLFSSWGGAAPLVRAPVVLTIVGVLLLQQLPKGLGQRVQERYSELSLGAKAALGALCLLVITSLGPPGVAPFIYFRF